MKIKTATAHAAMWILATIIVIVISGCDVEECSRDEMYIDGYQEIVYPSGATYFEPIWKCP